MKRTSSTHRWRTWYGRSVASRGKDSQCLSAYHLHRRGRRGRHPQLDAFSR
jgi:hypothetical protein